MKRIKRFNENEQIDISPERTNEIIDELKDMSSAIADKKKLAESIVGELESYKSDSSKSNDQIDDSIAALQLVIKDLETSGDKVDTTISNLQNYSEEGRKYLYSENKQNFLTYKGMYPETNKYSLFTAVLRCLKIIKIFKINE